MEGFCSTLAGFLGCGHATTTYGGNIGAIGVTRVSLLRNSVAYIRCQLNGISSLTYPYDLSRELFINLKINVHSRLIMAPRKTISVKHDY